MVIAPAHRLQCVGGWSGWKLRFYKNEDKKTWIARNILFHSFWSIDTTLTYNLKWWELSQALKEDASVSIWTDNGFRWKWNVTSGQKRKLYGINLRVANENILSVWYAIESSIFKIAGTRLLSRMATNDCSTTVVDGELCPKLQSRNQWKQFPLTYKSANNMSWISLIHYNRGFTLQVFRK